MADKEGKAKKLKRRRQVRGLSGASRLPGCGEEWGRMQAAQAAMEKGNLPLISVSVTHGLY